ncbi:co-chaperone HscB [Aliivibrio fischeri]|uniref:Co-chaperone protein HscB homolog n=3 Tax=Aliivibrio fischeri TaxID=668 RepID=HSCB_ALIF1|nr:MULTISPECIES: co-chaperone HscB [Aliivibrio]B5FAW3.1 RecName: Full=Co-chaperone protein HscB homolog [Aliivibrio fischeri MJ11]Q5E781.1 RecName: Full=Co-chaperone protein HscB homolog [Aliivibrio fischeri ES114]AAW85115.1 DnaJ-like molecular chaperone specific for Fe-S scaffold IscU [Aliivibrio fischeri ES114]ACH66665.1 Fe-S protein assembly co-chaperone HscB [Aliivibrio fischeri MJ11]KLU77370.1 cobalamin 5'-phosphate synthase [Aliivibrio fischeri]MBD1571095.1 co-chaperone HscB [Aliivibrio
MNHFELFGLPNQFELDGGLLSLQFRELQKRFHPDNFATSSERDRLLSIQKAAQINDAYQTLKNPVSRAEYILSEQGHDIRGEQTTMQDPMFLMQQMELREELESLPSSSDPESALFDFAENVTAMRKSQLVQLQELLKNEAWIEAAQSVRKLKFIEKLNQEVEQLEEKLLG